MSFKQMSQKEVVEVHVPKGCPNGHKIVFYEKADEIPDGVAGDVVIILQEQPHSIFKRHGADLYIQRRIALVEALCGFSMEVDHLDGRKLLVQTKPGDVIKPTTFDPFNVKEGNEWEIFEDTDCSLEPMAKADIDDAAKLKDVVSKGQLKGKGVGAFAISNGRTTFYKCDRQELMAAKTPRNRCTLYAIADPTEGAASRMMTAVPEAGLPVHKNYAAYGNLFLQLTVEFPSSLDPSAVTALKKALPPPLNAPATSSEDVEEVEVNSMDPVTSHLAGVPAEERDATEEDDDPQGGGGGQRVQCAQQ